MTVSSTTNRISYSCNGSQKEFPFNFKIFAKTDLIVILRDSGGNETTLTLTTDYTVSAGPWPTGGTVTTVKAYAEENTLVIIRELPQTQGADYVENDPFPAETHEEVLDRSVMLIQETIEKLGRMLIFAKSSSYSELSLPDPVASKLLAWKDDLSGIKNVEIQSQGDLSVTDFIKTLLDDEDATAALATLGLDTDLLTLALPADVTISAFIKTLLDDASAATARATLGIPFAFDSPLSIPSAAFMPRYNTDAWAYGTAVRNNGILTAQYYHAPVIFPNGVTVTKVTLYGIRNDANATMTLILKRRDFMGNASEMAFITADWTSGYNSKYDDSIDSALINTNNASYELVAMLDPNDSDTDVQLGAGKIEFTGP